MRTSKILFTAFLTVLAGCSSGPARRGGDVYKDFASLKTANTEGLDYSREVYDRGSRAAVFAIHGGDIEKATDRVARATAGKDFSLYIFNGWHGPKNADLHITATRFDDPQAVKLAAASALGISMHAQAAAGGWVCVGGRNAHAALLVAQRLEAAGFQAETPCARLPGTADANLVNRAALGGVQLEITPRLLSRLEDDRETLSKFSGAVRSAVLEYLASPEAKVKQVPAEPVQSNIQETTPQ